ncbi:MAG: PspC domain-containing protein [Mucilaginibacter sp.]|nr:PspC domain-containing protein [Mucilaginibacter sp.]
MEKKLYRDEQHKSIGGVCAGLADYFNMDVSIVRLIFVLALVLKGVGFIPYIILWIVLPKKPFGYQNPFKPGVNPTPGYDARYSQPYGDVKVDYTVPPVNQPGQPFMYQPQKKSNFGVIFGAILIVLGGLFLLDNLDIMPDFDFEQLWPVILVVAGLAVIFTGKKKPWEHHDAFQPEKKEADFNTATEPETDNNKQEDNNTSTF